jgi:hypothetical protein
VIAAIAEARKRAGEWPAEQLFWELHPVMDWLMDKLLVRFGRHEAPVLISPRLAAADSIYLWQGVISNQRSQPVIVDWFGARVADGRVWSFVTLAETLALAGFDRGLPNLGQGSARAAALAAALPAVVDEARGRMERLRQQRGDDLRQELLKDMRKLQAWRQAALTRIASQEASAHGVQAARLAHQRHEVEALYDQRQKWVTETLSTVGAPYLRLVAVFSGS